MKNIKKLLFTIAFFSVLIAPMFVSAATIEELQAQIAVLLRQIADLQTQIAQIQGKPAEWCHDFNINLKIGDTGSEVAALVGVLEKEGFLQMGAAGVTGISEGSGVTFDESIAAAVTGFQQKYANEILTPLGLKYGTGFVGKATRAKLNLLYGCRLKPPITPSVSEQVKCVFNGSQSEQKCSTAVTDASNIYYNRGCSGVGACVVDIQGYKGDSILWKSSCPEGYAYTTVDGQSESINFKCGASTTPSITVLSPNGGERFVPGQSITVKWKSQKISRVSANLQYTAKGETFGIATSVFSDDNSGALTEKSGTMIIPQDAFISNNYKIWIAESGNIYPANDYSDAPFSIVAATADTVTLQGLAIDSNNLKVTYSKNFATCAHLLNENSVITHTQNFFCQQGDNLTVSQPLTNFTAAVTSGAKLKLCHGNNYGICSALGVVSTATSPSITVLSPNGGEQIAMGATYPISWKLNGSLPSRGVNIELRKNGQYVGTLVGLGGIEIPVSWSWSVSQSSILLLVPGSGYTIRVYESGNPLNYDDSDAPFSIIAATPTSGRQTQDRTDDNLSAKQIHVIYVVPSDGADRQFDTNGALNTSIAAFQRWHRGQTGGKQFRMDTYQGALDITFVRLGRTDSQIQADARAMGSPLNLRDILEREVRSLGFNDSRKLYAVYYEGGAGVSACGGGAWPPALPGNVAAMYLLACSNPFASSETSLGYLDIAMFHEIYHSLGAVSTCASHHTRAGHVSDSRDDFMGSWLPSGYANAKLDIGRDDYYGLTQKACENQVDMAQSPFLEVR